MSDKISTTTGYTIDMTTSQNPILEMAIHLDLEDDVMIMVTEDRQTEKEDGIEIECRPQLRSGSTICTMI